MRIDFSEMRDHAVVEELFDLDRQVASLLILDAPDDVLREAERELETKLEEVEDMYNHDESAITSIHLSMPGVHMVLDAIRDKRGIYGN